MATGPMSLAEIPVGKLKRGKGPRGKRDLLVVRRDAHALDQARKAATKARRQARGE